MRPEFINRIDEVISFNQLTRGDFERIAVIMLKFAAGSDDFFQIQFAFDIEPGQRIIFCRLQFLIDFDIEQFAMLCQQFLHQRFHLCRGGSHFLHIAQHFGNDPGIDVVTFGEKCGHIVVSASRCIFLILLCQIFLRCTALSGSNFTE